MSGADDPSKHLEDWRAAYEAARGQGLDHHQAQDAASDAWTAAWGSKAGGSRAFTRAYFRTAGANRAKDQFKRKERRDLPLEDFVVRAEQAPEGHTPEEQLGGRALDALPDELVLEPEPGPGIPSDRLLALVESLPEPERSVVRYCDQEGWQRREVGEILGMTPKAVSNHLSRGRVKVRRTYLAKEAPSPSGGTRTGSEHGSEGESL